MMLLKKRAEWAVQCLTDGVVKWNPFNRVVQDHITGQIAWELTKECRDLLGLPPFRPGDRERERERDRY